MKKRIPDDIIQELIDNDGCRTNNTHTINATGIVRLALDLQEARKEIERLKRG